ncbi:MAG: hypothetical protein ABI864_01225 [Chloroflexota bacterium]
MRFPPFVARQGSRFAPRMFRKNPSQIVAGSGDPDRSTHRAMTGPSRFRVSATALVLMVGACNSPASTPSQTPVGSSSPASSASPTPVSPLVGQWMLDRTCADIVEALTVANQTDLIPKVVSEHLYGPDTNTLPADFDPANPCANARPATEHSHTFWADGTFNSWDQNGSQVDDGTYSLVDDRTFTMGLATFHFAATADTIMFDVVIPEECSTQQCIDDLGWAFSVAYPGQTWTRVTSGPHVP